MISVKKEINKLSNLNLILPKINSKTIFLEQITNLFILIKNNFYLFQNKLNDKSIWPNELKLAVVVPVYEAGSRFCITNYIHIWLYVKTYIEKLEKLLENNLQQFDEISKQI